MSPIKAHISNFNFYLNPMTTRKFFKKVHLWLSLPVGLIITIICITGAILSFETEILESYYPERYFVKEIKETKIPVDQLIPIVNAQLKDNTVASIKVSSNPERTYIASLSEGFRISAFVDPYTGDLKGTYSFRDSFFFTMMSLHRWLMDGSRTWGKYTVGITTILFVFILISGLVWWFPTDKKKLKSRFKIKTKSGLKRFLHDIHVSLGIYVCIFLLISALTGLMWSFEWYRNGVCKLFGVEVPAEKEGKGGGGKGNKEGKAPKEINYQSWQAALDNLTKQVPNNEYITISDGSATILDKSAPHLRATDKYSLDNTSGEVLKVELFADQKSVSKIMSWAYALHVGAFGGIIVRILTCIACTIGGTLPLTGYYMFYRKSLKKSKKKRPIPSAS